MATEIPRALGPSAELVAVRTENPNPPAAAEADQASSEGGGHDAPAGDGATRRPEADSKFEIRNPKSGGRAG